MTPPPPPDQPDDDFLERVMRWQDGTLSAEELAALEAEMLACTAKRRAFAALQMQSLLLNEVLRREAYAPHPAAGSAGDEADVVNTVVPFPAARVSFFRRYRLPLAAAALLAVALGAWLLRSLTGGGDGIPDLPGTLAVVNFADEAEWSGGLQPDHDRLTAGTYSLAAGTVRLKFEHDDTVATLAGPARFDVVAPGHVRLHEGRLSARVTQPDKGFTVLTDAVTVLDRGTVFGVDVRPDGEAVVSVLEGKVDVSEPGSKEMQRIEQGGRLSARPKGRRTLQPADDAPSGFEDLWPLTLGVDRLSQLVEFVVPRARHKWQDYRSDTRLFLMPERQRVTASGPLSVDVLPGVRADHKKRDPQGRALTHSGRVNSYLLFFRPMEDAKERRPAISGSITFSQPVIGIISDSRRLVETDAAFGHPRAVYQDKPRRGIENWKKTAERDNVYLSKDGRRLFFNLHSTADPDEFRVLTAAP